MRGHRSPSGRTEFLAPRLEVEGVGPIALPLLPSQAKQLIKAAARAPYGRGADTVVETKVRRTWQIEAARVGISGKHWAKTLDGIVERAAEGLGVAEPVSAELYKLLVYDKDSFFVSHRDTEQAPGMFVTLVLALPSQSKGGELLVRHQDREARLDLACEEPSECCRVGLKECRTMSSILEDELRDGFTNDAHLFDEVSISKSYFF